MTTMWVHACCPVCKQPYTEILNGSWVKKQREDRGVKQKDLAARLGVSRSYVSQWEHGRRKIPAQRAATIIAFFSSLADGS